jgi:hypothetical protein
MILPFDERGNLPPGIHSATWRELEDRFGDTPWRRFFLLKLREALTQLQSAHCRTVYIDGSFVTANDAPDDFDACWESDGVDVATLDPVLLDFSEGRRAQKERYWGELLPADMVAEPAGISVLDFFQRDRVSQSKGIVKIDLETGL